MADDYDEDDRDRRRELRPPPAVAKQLGHAREPTGENIPISEGIARSNKTLDDIRNRMRDLERRQDKIGEKTEKMQKDISALQTENRVIDTKLDILVAEANDQATERAERRKARAARELADYTLRRDKLQLSSKTQLAIIALISSMITGVIAALATYATQN